MKNIIHTHKARNVALDGTFHQLQTGSVTLAQVIAERRAARAALLAAETPYLRRRREVAEQKQQDPFSASYCL